jgi:hypothetical protein
LLKRIIYGAIRNNVLNYHDLELLIAQTINLMNKRPLAFKEALRDEKSFCVPAIITPELLTRGRELTTDNLIPALQPNPEGDREWSTGINSHDALMEQFAKLRRVRENLVRNYNEEFRETLVSQAVNAKGRYKPIKHELLKIGDLVLLKDPMLKANNYSMARVTKVEQNDGGEVTGVIVKNGSTRETVKRHVSSVIPLLRPEPDHSPAEAIPDPCLPSRRDLGGLPQLRVA